MEAWTQELLRLSSLFADRMQDGDKVIAYRSDVASPVLSIADKRADKIFQFLRMAPGICRRSREGVARASSRTRLKNGKERFTSQPL